MKSIIAAFGACFRPRLSDVVKCAALLTLVTAGAAEDGSPSSADQWHVIEAYDVANRAYWTKHSEIRRADVAAQERERLQRDLGPAPDDSAAVAAAKYIIETTGDRVLDAADFLLNRARPSEDDQRWVLDAMAGHFGPNWLLVEDYMESQAEWLAAANIAGSDEEAARRYGQGVSPPTWHAASAARACVESAHERAAEAAQFLAQQAYSVFSPSDGPSSPSPGGKWWLPHNRAFGESALAKLIGPDWNVVQDYDKRSRAWIKAEQAIRAADVVEEEMGRRLRELGDAPEPYQAVIAALAIVETGSTHKRILEAAEFLLDNPTPGGAAKMLREPRRSPPTFRTTANGRFD